MRKQNIKTWRLLVAPTHHAGFATIPSSLLQVGSLRRLVSLPTGSRPDHWRLELLFERHPGPKRALPPRRDVLVQDVLPTAAQRYDVAVSVCENMCESETCMDSKSSSTTVSTNWVLFASNIFEPVLRQGVSDQDKRALSSLAWGANMLLARSCGADLEDHQSVFRTLWRVHRSWSLAIPAEFRTPVSHEIVLSAAMSAWLHNVPELSLLTLLSFHCLFRPAGSQATSMVRRENCWWIPLNTLRKV